MVTTISGGSTEAINVPKASSLTSVTTRRPLVAEKEGVVLDHDALQLEAGEPGARRGHGHRERVTAHERGDREAQLVEAVRGDQLAEPVRAALTEHHPATELGQSLHGGCRLDAVVTGHDDVRDLLGLRPALRIRVAQVITWVRAPSGASVNTLAVQSKANDRLTTASGGIGDCPAAGAVPGPPR